MYQWIIVCLLLDGSDIWVAKGDDCKPLVFEDRGKAEEYAETHSLSPYRIVDISEQEEHEE